MKPNEFGLELWMQLLLLDLISTFKMPEVCPIFEFPLHLIETGSCSTSVI